MTVVSPPTSISWGSPYSVIGLSPAITGKNPRCAKLQLLLNYPWQRVSALTFNFQALTFLINPHLLSSVSSYSSFFLPSHLPPFIVTHFYEFISYLLMIYHSQTVVVVILHCLIRIWSIEISRLPTATSTSPLLWSYLLHWSFSLFLFFHDLKEDFRTTSVNLASQASSSDCVLATTFYLYLLHHPTLLYNYLL